MKKIKGYIPMIVAIGIFAVFAILFILGAFDAPKETSITSSTLTEVIQMAKLTTAKYVQHGIAKAHIEGKQDGFIMYYAIVKANVDFEDIKHEIDEDKKTVTVTIPETFSFDVELLFDEDKYQWYYYPDNKKDWTGKDAIIICYTDAKAKAERNKDLITKARESLVDTLETLLNPLLSKNGYQLVFAPANSEGE